MAPAKQKVYRDFEFEHKSVEDLATQKGLAFTTINNYLEEAILNGLPVNFARLGVTEQMINRLEEILRLPPISSSNFNY